jgi:hypothetical protein
VHIENSLKRKRSDDHTHPGTPESDYLSVHNDATAASVEQTNNVLMQRKQKAS